MNDDSHQLRQSIAIGISDFKDLRERGARYVDKSLFIREVIESPAQVLLLPRPRRFGKTLNLSMLRYFFEAGDDTLRSLFEGLAIWQDALFDAYQGTYPVIYLTFKDLKDFDWQTLLPRIGRVIAEPVMQHRRILEGEHLSSGERQYWDRLLHEAGSQQDYEDCLRMLSKHLSQYYDQQVVLLIDEYDAPILSGYVNGYYAEIIGFMRNLLGGGLKDSPYLFKGVLTGILRVARESIFSGLNNLAVYSLLRQEFSTAFGFTEAEVGSLLEEYDLEQQKEEVAIWYNGYQFGEAIMYNPWSVLNYIASVDRKPRPYWINTGDPAIIQELVTGGNREIREEIGKLMEGVAIEKLVDENIIMQDLEVRDEILWGFLLFSGYLKAVAQVDEETYRLQIPNHEVLLNYRQWVRSWFSHKVETPVLEEMLRGLEIGDMVVFERMLRRVVTQIMSYHDLGNEPEKVYHALVLGMLVWMSGKYEIRSNRESGYGRYDLLLRPKDAAKHGIIIEFKRVYEDEKPDEVLKEALQQIQARRYSAELEAAGVQRIITLAIVFQGKQLWMREG